MSGTEVDSEAAALDSFEAFNRAMGSDTVIDPYPMLALARAIGPLADVSADLASLGVSDEDAAEAGGLFNAYSYEAVSDVLRNGEAFSSSGYAEVMGQVMGHSILEMDEP